MSNWATTRVLLAENLPAESYLDTGNRGMFEDSDAPRLLYPNLVEANEQLRREAGSCAPLAVRADQVKPIGSVWLHAPRNWAIAVSPPTLSEDPHLRLVADGREIRPVRVTDEQYTFVLPPRTGTVCIRSREAAPADANPWHDDRRRLGVSISQLILRYESDLTEIPVDHPALLDGWHDVERDGNRQWRWTDGAARLSVPSGAHLLEIHLGSSVDYPAETVATTQGATQRAA